MESQFQYYEEQIRDIYLIGAPEREYFFPPITESQSQEIVKYILNCQYCSQHFEWRFSIENHYKTEHPNKLLHYMKCNYCPTVFTNCDDIAYHFCKPRVIVPRRKKIMNYNNQSEYFFYWQDVHVQLVPRTQPRHLKVLTEVSGTH